MNTEERPTSTGARRLLSRHGAVDVFGRFGLLIILLLVIVAFSVMEPESFGSWLAFRATFDQQSVILLVALAAMVPLLVGEFDLSVGAIAGLANIFIVGFAENQGMEPGLAFACTIAIAMAIGLTNGLIVTQLQVNAFVTTLGTGTMLGGIGLVYTGQAYIPSAPENLTSIARGSVIGLPASVIYAGAIALLALLVLQFLPIGRKMAAVGANRRAADLTGIPVDRYIVASFVTSGLLAGLAGALFGAQIGSATNNAGASFLLPAFAAAFLGSTAFSPGRFNVPGTLTAVLLLAFLVSGLQRIGVDPWIEPIVNGGALIVAVGLSAWARRLRIARLRREQLHTLERRDRAEQALSGQG